MKRTMVTLLALLLALAPLTGVAFAEEPMQITVCPLSQPVDNEGLVAKAFAEKFGAQFDFWYTQGDKAALAVRLAGGEIPDLFYGDSTMESSDFLKYIDDGVIAEIPLDMVKQYAPNLYAMYEKETPYWLEKVMVDGKLYGLPRVLAEGGNARMPLVWRGDWLKNVGIEKVPETLEEFEEAIYKFTREDPDQNGKDDTYGLSWSALNAVYGAYGYMPEAWSKKDGQLVYGAVQPEMKQALALLAKWYADGVIEPEFVGKEDRGNAQTSIVTAPFVNGIIGVTAHNDYFYYKPAMYEGDRDGENIVELRKLNPDAIDSLVFGLPPVGPEGKRGLSMRPLLYPQMAVMGRQVAEDPAKMQKILEILDFGCATFDGFIMSRYGIEGQTFDYQEVPERGRVPVALPQYSNWLDITKEGGGIAFNFGIWFMEICKHENSALWWKENKHPELNQDGYLDEVFLVPPSMPKYKAELDTIREQAYISIITGDKPVDSFDEFVKMWGESGGDKVFAELNP